MYLYELLSDSLVRACTCYVGRRTGLLRPVEKSRAAKLRETRIDELFRSRWYSTLMGETAHTDD